MQINLEVSFSFRIFVLTKIIKMQGYNITPKMGKFERLFEKWMSNMVSSTLMDWRNANSDNEHFLNAVKINLILKWGEKAYEPVCKNIELNFRKKEIELIIKSCKGVNPLQRRQIELLARIVPTNLRTQTQIVEDAMAYCAKSPQNCVIAHAEGINGEQLYIEFIHPLVDLPHCEGVMSIKLNGESSIVYYPYESGMDGVKGETFFIPLETKKFVQLF